MGRLCVQVLRCHNPVVGWIGYIRGSHDLHNVFVKDVEHIPDLGCDFANLRLIANLEGVHVG
jgi:hypothetical protein